MEYIVAFSLSIFFIYKSQQNRLGYYSYFLSILPIIVIAALRTIEIGVDTGVYVYPLFRLAKLQSSLTKLFDYSSHEEFYLIYAYVLTRFCKNFNEYLFWEHSLMYGFAVYALYKIRHKIQVWQSLFILLFVFYRESLNIARQSFAIYIDLIAFTFLIGNKYKLSILFAVLAYGFHHSSPIFFFVIVLKICIDKFRYYFTKRKIKILLILGLFAIFTFFSYVANYLEGLGVIEEKYVERYARQGHYGANFPISLFALCLVNLGVFYYVKFKRKIYKYDNNLILFEYILIVALICCFTGLISTFTIRIGAYFWYMTIIIIPILFNRYTKPDIILKTLCCFYALYWILTVVIANLSGTYPYISVYSI